MKLNRKNDYMKYWRIVRKIVKEKYGIGTEQLDFLLFLHSEEYFSAGTFREYSKLFNWKHSRFRVMIVQGWIVNFKKQKNSNKAIYGLSNKATNLVNEVYRLLNKGVFSENGQANPFFKKTNVPYTFKLYANAIVKINEATKQQQRHSLE